MQKNYKELVENARKALANGDPVNCAKIIGDFLKETGGKNVPITAMLLELQGRALFAQGKMAEGCERLKKGGELLKKYFEQDAVVAAPFAELLIALLNNLTFALVEQRLFEEADTAGAEAVACAKKYSPEASPILASALFSHSTVKFRIRDYTSAENNITEAQKIWETAGNLEKVATCLNNLGRIHEERGEIASGIALHQRAVALRRKLPDKRDLAFSLGNLGVALASENRLLEAAASLEESVKIYREAGLGNLPECHGFAQNLELCKNAVAECKLQ